MVAAQTELLTADDAGIARSAGLLATGHLVAIPTETVYGLAADARNDHAVARVFAAKGRPSFNPLIVHCASTAAAEAIGVFSDAARVLASAFWPGALTLVVPLRREAGIAPLVTAGLDTVALRVPAHPVAQAVIATAGRPLAAPSANPSGRISPTEARHVLDGLAGRIDAVLDAGPCPVGVESTIIGTVGDPTLLRAGGLPREAIEAALGHALATPADGPRPSAPGQLASHYAPEAPLRLDATTLRKGERLLGFGHVDGAELNLSEAGDLTEAAANLFHHLHEMDRRAGSIAVSPIPEHGLGLAINDRLRRAAAPRP